MTAALQPAHTHIDKRCNYKAVYKAVLFFRNGFMFCGFGVSRVCSCMDFEGVGDEAC